MAVMFSSQRNSLIYAGRVQLRNGSKDERKKKQYSEYIVLIKALIFCLVKYKTKNHYKLLKCNRVSRLIQNAGQIITKQTKC